MTDAEAARLARARAALEEQLEFAAIYGSAFDLDEAARQILVAADDVQPGA